MVFSAFQVKFAYAKRKIAFLCVALRSFCDSLKPATEQKKGVICMGDDVGVVLLLRELVTALVGTCEDASLLDLIHKLLLNV